MSPEFLKSLIQLLAQHGGTFTCPLSELQQLCLELSLQNISSDNAATLTLRLGARIYYVPAKTEEAPEWPSTPIQTSPTPAGPATSTKPSPLARSVESELQAVNSLNNRAPVDEVTEATARHVPAVKSELDLYLLEQSHATKRTAAAESQAKELRNRNREYPWEIRKPQ